MKNKKIKYVLPLSVALSTTPLTGCNRTIIDTKYGLDTALIVGNDTALSFDISEWKDYEGEQYQLLTKEGLLMLTSSFDTDLFYGDSQEYSIDTISKNAISDTGEVYDYSNDNDTTIFNYDLLDTRWAYNKAALFNNNKALILNVAKWRDYQGEQIQIVTDENMVLLLSSYNSKLFYDKQSNIKAAEFVQMYIGSNGKVSELGEKIDDTIFNYDLIDLNYNFDRIIIFKDEKAVILPISEWYPYEGEQIQVKVINGPTLVTAAYDSILINDVKSKSKAIDVANKICDEVTDYSEGVPLKEGIFNKTLIDLEYGFNNGIISNNSASAVIPISKWHDYEGEQLQVKLPNGDTMLTSSIFLDMLNGGSDEINASTIAKNYANKVIDNGINVTKKGNINYQIFDFDFAFNYALHIENENVTIIPLASWKHYYNKDGLKSVNYYENSDGSRRKDDDEAAPNCEQLQLKLPDGTVLLTSAYDTILLKTNNVLEYAEYFRKENGVITNLEETFGRPTNSIFNFNLIDLNWRFNYAIYNNGINSQVFEINNWLDFKDGEQVQIKFQDNKGMLTSYPNTTLIYTKDKEKAEKIAQAFAGNELDKTKIYTYKSE